MTVMDIINFLGPGINIMIGIILALILVILILFFVQHRLKKKAEQNLVQTNDVIAQAEAVKNMKKSGKSLEKQLIEINKFTRNMLHDRHNINKRADYAEIEVYFRARKKKDLAKFCEMMNEALYAGNKVTKKMIDDLLKSLQKIFADEGLSNPMASHLDIVESQNKIISQNEQVSEQINNPLSHEELAKKVAGVERQMEMKKLNAEVISPPAGLVDMPAQEIKALPMVSDVNTLRRTIPRDKIMEKLNSLDEDQVRGAYAELQKRFHNAFRVATNQKNKADLKILSKFKKGLLMKLDDYERQHRLVEFAEEISKGAMLLNELNYIDDDIDNTV